MWRKKDKNPNEPRVDRMVLAVRQRRVLSAVEQVATLPEFFGLRIKPRTLMDSDRLDARRQSLGAAEGVRRQWSGPAALATALQTMAGLIPDEGVNLHLDEADEARWMHAKSMPAMVKAVATALPTLQLGFAIFGDDELPELVEGEAPRFRADAPTLIVDLGLNADGRRSCTTVLAGSWPPEVYEALAG